MHCVVNMWILMLETLLWRMKTRLLEWCHIEVWFIYHSSTKLWANGKMDPRHDKRNDSHGHVSQVQRKSSLVEGCSLIIRQSQRMLQTRELIFDYLIKPCFHHKFEIGQMETLSSIASYYSTRPPYFKDFRSNYAQKSSSATPLLYHLSFCHTRSQSLKLNRKLWMNLQGRTITLPLMQWLLAPNNQWNFYSFLKVYGHLIRTLYVCTQLPFISQVHKYCHNQFTCWPHWENLPIGNGKFSKYAPCILNDKS